VPFVEHPAGFISFATRQRRLRHCQAAAQPSVTSPPLPPLPLSRFLSPVQPTPFPTPQSLPRTLLPHSEAPPHYHVFRSRRLPITRRPDAQCLPPTCTCPPALAQMHHAFVGQPTTFPVTLKRSKPFAIAVDSQPKQSSSNGLSATPMKRRGPHLLPSRIH
jgi:hypothetical protein